MKITIIFTALVCLALISLQGAMPVTAKIGRVTFHVFKDVDNDRMLDANETSPPWAVVNLKKQGGMSRVRCAVFSGDVTYRFVFYPNEYHVYVDYFRSPEGLGVEDWSFDGTLRLDEETIGSVIYIPLNYSFTPGP